MADIRIVNLVCDNLPEDWRIDIRLERGCADVLLFDPNGRQVVKPFEDDEPNIKTMVIRRVAYARTKDGLVKTTKKGSPR